ncbi:MAG: TVP38/TMEM64 family protein [Acidimicrobiales bacterium]|nr:TVP38/TMEM64 family protein [Acidimicrobiales bacterium]
MSKITASDSSISTKPLPLAKVLLGIVAVIALAGLGRQFGLFLERFAVWVDNLGSLGPFAFIAGYAAATLAFVPGSVLTLAGGAIFGLLNGSIYALTGATLGATLSFLLARYAAREAVERRLEGNPRFQAIDHAVGQRGLKIVLLLRLSPIFPFNLLNYALGLTKIPLKSYLFASIGMLPGTVLYTYSGLIIGDVARLAGGTGPERDVAYYAVVVLGLLATILVLTTITRTAKQALTAAGVDAKPIDSTAK